MSRPFFAVGRLERRLSNGNIEDVRFEPGVNLMIGRANTGKTKWLQTLDYLLGDTGESPLENVDEGLIDKYDSAAVELNIGDDQLLIERRWKERGSKTKILIDGEAKTTSEYQQFLLQKLGIPILNYPKGNPMSGQTWPELSFRSLLRHMYRRQRFWTDLADKQPEGEQHACLLQFLGIAENLFTEEYGQLVKLKMESDRLRARRDQYGQTLDELAKDVISEVGLSVGANVTTVSNAEASIAEEIEFLRKQREKILSDGSNHAISPENRGHVSQLAEERASILVKTEDLRQLAKAIENRLDGMCKYRKDIGDELDRMARAKDAGDVLGDLKITHCPACDQPVIGSQSESEECFLCHQVFQEEPISGELGSTRIQFEVNRLSGEFKEANELVEVLESDKKRTDNGIKKAEERLKMLENEIAPARMAVAAFVQEEISAIDMALGELNERQRQVGRISVALGKGHELTNRIAEIEHEIEPLQDNVNEAVRATDFDATASLLEEGMNAYLFAINILRPDVWRHSPVTVGVNKSNFTIKVGPKRWDKALGGTDTLYFLMAYHYGLISLSNRERCYYPGLSIIDVPGEFAGEAVADKENFIVQPFIDLLNQEEFSGTQMIMTGVSFSGLENVSRIQLAHIYSA